MSQNIPSHLPPPDKKIPLSVILIGTFELATALLGLVKLMLIGDFDIRTAIVLVLWFLYGSMGAGLLAIQEWARYSNIVWHLIAIPYSLFLVAFLEVPADWVLAFQIVISGIIIYALTRPAIRYKFQTVVPKKKHH